MRTHNIDGIIFDLDGTVYLGETALPGAMESIAELRRRGKRVLFVATNPWKLAALMQPNSRGWAFLLARTTSLPRTSAWVRRREC